MKSKESFISFPAVGAEPAPHRERVGGALVVSGSAGWRRLIRRFPAESPGAERDQIPQIRSVWSWKLAAAGGGGGVGALGSEPLVYSKKHTLTLCRFWSRKEEL